MTGQAQPKRTPSPVSKTKTSSALLEGSAGEGEEHRVGKVLATWEAFSLFSKTCSEAWGDKTSEDSQ